VSEIHTEDGHVLDSDGRPVCGARLDPEPGFAEAEARKGKRVQVARNPSGDVVLTVLSATGVVIVHAVLTEDAFRNLAAVLPEPEEKTP
jgi:hypothetical protein